MIVDGYEWRENRKRTTFCCYVKVLNARDMTDEEFGEAVRNQVVEQRRWALALEHHKSDYAPVVDVSDVSWLPDKDDA